MANVYLTLLHGLGLDDMQSFGDSTGPIRAKSRVTRGGAEQ